MIFNFKNLDESTRNLMISELRNDINSGTLYLSKRFNQVGESKYPNLLEESFRTGSEETLADSLEKNECFKDYETRNTKNGSVMARVPQDTARIFSQGEFNRFYIRALCLRAEQENKKLLVYRAKESSNPRSESEAMIGKLVEAKTLLVDLRENKGVDTALGLPSGPNSGLSVELV